MADDGERLEDVLDRLQEAGREGEVTAGDLVDAFAERTAGAALAAIGVLAAVPVIGGLPGAPIVLAALAVTVAVSALAGARGGGGVWLPPRLRRFGLDRDRFRRGVEALRPWAARVDRRLRPRLTTLTRGPGRPAAMLVGSVLLALSMIPLGLIPFGVLAPATGLAALGLALMTRDGFAALAGLSMAGVTAWAGAAAL